MSQEEILRNVYAFFQILETSQTKDVEKWDIHALKNALKWAEWCELLSVKASGKYYELDLNAEIMKLNHLPWSLGSSILDLDYLKEARLHLTVGLLENVYLGSTLYSYCVESCLDVNDPGNSKTFIKTCAKLTSKKVTAGIARDLLADVGLEKRKSGQAGSHLLRQTHALHLLLFVGSTLEKAQPSVRQRTVLLLNKKLRKTLETCDKGWETLMLCLSADDHFHAQAFILDFLRDYISSLSDHQRRHVLSNVNMRHLCILVKNSHDISVNICDWLESEGKTMAPCLERGKLNWRNTRDDGISYISLCDITQQLWKCDSSVASLLHKRLFTHSAYCVWHSIKRLIY